MAPKKVVDTKPQLIIMGWIHRRHRRILAMWEYIFSVNSYEYVVLVLVLTLVVPQCSTRQDVTLYECDKQLQQKSTVEWMLGEASH